MSNFIEVIQNSANEYNGSCTFRFSQALPPISQLIATDPATKDGFCQAITNMWIAKHAAGGSLWSELYTTVTGRQCFNIHKVKNLMVEQRAARGILSQLLNNEKYLACQGVIPRENPVTKAYAFAGTLGRTSHNAKAVAKTIVESTRAGCGSYLNVALYNESSGGHAVAVFVGSPAFGSGTRDIAYFDANFGEFWFQDSSDFHRWFIAYWKKIYEMGDYKYKSFYINEFAHKA